MGRLRDKVLGALVNNKFLKIYIAKIYGCYPLGCFFLVSGEWSLGYGNKFLVDTLSYVYVNIVGLRDEFHGVHFFSGGLRGRRDGHQTMNLFERRLSVLIGREGGWKEALFIRRLRIHLRFEIYCLFLS